MLNFINDFGRELLIQPSCPICQTSVEAHTAHSPCLHCLARLGVSVGGIRGCKPLPWHALGLYQGQFRSMLLRERQRPCQRRLKGLIELLREGLNLSEKDRLVPIPSWKTRQANALPQRIAAGLGHCASALLYRRQAGVSQHRLNRHLRQANLQGAFVVAKELVRAVDERHDQTQTWIVDDILTTGATALAARDALEQAGYPVRGLICLARTPADRPERARRDLRFHGRDGDRPG